MNLTEKIISSHLVFGALEEGTEIGLRVDQTITQDALGMIAYLAFEGMGQLRVQTELSVSYLDHNMLYTDYRNPDDHAYLRSVARKYGIYLSRAGNGICHSVHLARFSKPGKIVVGTDSHTPSAGAAGMLGIGAGGMDVAAVMAGEAIVLQMPRVTRVLLKGKLNPGVNAKDAALWLLKRLTVKGGVGTVLEYAGDGLDNLSVPERMTLANMGAEAGATSSIFPADARTKHFFIAQEREVDFNPLCADDDAIYAETITCNLFELCPMVALPHQPDRAVPVSEVGKVAVDQVFIGSCANSSFSDLMRAAEILKGRVVAEGVSLIVSPGTRQNFKLLLEGGAIDTFVQAGARILECGCGPCVGIGQAVQNGGVSLRTSNRNFKGRCGTLDSHVYLSGPETAAATAVLGYLATARELCDPKILAAISEPGLYGADDSMIIFPAEDGSETEILRGPNIKPVPLGSILPETLKIKVVKKVGDNVSTDEIAPSDQQYVADRSNIPNVSKSTFGRQDQDFWKRAVAYKNTVIVAGENYGQGSSREHAALMPMFLGVRAVVAKSFARIHRTNLINCGLLPLIFENPEDYELLSEDHELEIPDIMSNLDNGCLKLRNLTTGADLQVGLNSSPHENDILRVGGLLRYIKSRAQTQTVSAQL